MSTRPILIVAGLCAVAGLGACQSRYADTYSFKKNNFQAPVTVHKDITPPTLIDPTQGVQGLPATPGAAQDVPGLPAVPGATAPGAAAPGTPAPGTAPAPATGIPGLDPAPAPGTTPTPPK